MKTNSLAYILLFLSLLTSCISTSYFQVYKTSPFNNIVLKDNYLVYEDENCKISYDLWDEGGNIGFIFFNKTENNIYLNLEESFFILNGVSFNYYKNRVFTNSTTTGASASSGATTSKSVTGFNYLYLLQTNRIYSTNTAGILTSSGFSVSYNEEKIIIIPSKTSKIISEYRINESLFRNCDLYKYPTKKEIRTKTYTKTDSPFIFSNRIAYTTGQSGDLIKFTNEFFVSEITNYPEKEIIISKYDEYCGQKSVTETKYFKEVSPDKFYIKYTKGQDTWKH